MKPIVHFKTENGNCYLFSFNKKQFILIHPIVYEFLNRFQNIHEIEVFINSIKKNPVTFANNKVTKEKLLYFFSKILFLKKNGYFEKPEIGKKLKGRLTSDTVLKNFVNTDGICFEVTDNCNMKCKYCAYGYFYYNYDTRKKKNLSVNSALNLINYYFSLLNSGKYTTSYNKIIDFGFYGGEPLMNFSFIQEIVQYIKNCKRVHNRYKFSMTTNGTLIAKHIKFLVKNKFNLLISLDGYENNNSFRIFKNGKNSFNEIINNLRKIEKDYPSYFRKKVIFNAVLHNKNSVSDIHSFFSSQFPKIPVLISELNPYGIHPCKKDEFNDIYRDKRESLSQAINCSKIEKDIYFNMPERESLSFLIRTCSGFVFRNLLEFIHSTESIRHLPTSTCFPFSKMIFLTVNGKLLPCEAIGHENILGHVDDNSVPIDFKWIAEKYNSYYNLIEQDCFTCYKSLSCPKCIFLMDLNQKKTICSGHTNYNSFSEYLKGRFNYAEKEPGCLSYI